ncbi:3-ketoacyl-CoA thiolase, mitochondrial [Trichinella murrelli]|uniref:3-ketoacyl-CoA thiolase, mitochondrial n=1 Tax=Trichinella murrelli TaxID=144512 RepID=A0A0V0U6J0_9BILA|nr:3-ketoacyl-CoA thiolase, mitochondrial [Trichinella murrelli]
MQSFAWRTASVDPADLQIRVSTICCIFRYVLLFSFEIDSHIQIFRIIVHVFIVAGKRTAFGAYGGKLKNHTPIDMGEIVARAALEASGVSPNNVNSVIFGNCIHASDDAGYLARHVTLRMGLPIHVPAMSVNRLCGSGFQSIIDAAREIMVGDSNVVIAGGSESMSQATYAVRDVRFGTKFGAKLGLHDTLMETLTDTFVGAPMGMTAETIATKFGITRQQADEVALRSQTRWRLANNNGYFKQEIVPVKVKTKKGEENFEVDEHPRETSMEILGKLPSAFKKGGIVTAGNASGICDGASAVIVASEKAVKDYHLTPLVKIIGWNVSGCDPSIMGIGPVPAVKGLMEKVQMNLKDMDLVEVNEAFASQCAVVERELKLDPDKTNVNGGAIALGHPLATSGNRIVVHLMHELRRRNLKYGLGSACIGGGQGIAMILENTDMIRWIEVGRFYFGGNSISFAIFIMTYLRQFKCTDLFEFTRINLDPLTETYSLNFYLHYLSQWPDQFLVAENHNGELMGYIMGKTEGDGENLHGHVTAVSVDCRYRRLGSAVKLIAALEDVSEKKNAYYVDLYVRVSNRLAVDIYLSQGYALYRRVIGYYSGDQEEDAYDMRKALPIDVTQQSLVTSKRSVHPDELPQTQKNGSRESITCAGFAGYFAYAARTNPTFKRTTRIIYYSLAAGAAYVGVENARRDWRKLRNTFT